MHVFVCVLLVPVVDGLHLSLLIGAAAAAFETDSLSLSLSLSPSSELSTSSGGVVF